MSPLKNGLAAAFVSIAWICPAQADLRIYEPFAYPTTGNTDEDGSYLGDGTQSGALGLTGAWTTAINNIEMEVRDEAMTFTDGGGNVLPSNGLSIRRSNRSGFCTNSISVDPSATAALTADNTTMWMSFLYEDEGFSGPDSSVMLTTGPLALANNHTLAEAGYGVGILVGESAQAESSAVESGYYLDSVGTTRQVSDVKPNDSENVTFFLAAKINWKPDGTPDEIFVFNITDLTTEPQEEDAIASDTFDMPLTAQQALDTLNIGETQVDAFDEIRFGDTFADVVGGAAPTDTLKLTIAPNATTPGNYDFSWSSQDGKTYDLVSALDLSTAAPDAWLVWDGRTGLVGAAPTNMLTDIPGGGDPRRFFAVIERDPPPPPPLLEETFDAAGPGLPAGWVASNATTIWDVGDPTGLPGLTGDDDTNCVGTNVAAGNYADEVATVTLTSPSVAIPAGGATLDFRQYIDSEAANGDVGAVRLLDASDTEIVEGDFPVTGIDGVESGWSNESFALPASAAGQNVKVVFEFTTAADGTVYKGFYIDDVVITGN